jgi:hypothetical protein
VGVAKERHVADAAAAAAVELTGAEIAELEQLADALGINAIRFWEKVMDSTRPSRPFSQHSNCLLTGIYQGSRRFDRWKHGESG